MLEQAAMLASLALALVGAWFPRRCGRGKIAVIRFGTRSGRSGSRLTGLLVAVIFFVVSLGLGFLFILPGVEARLSGVKTQGIVKSLEECPEDSGGGVVLGSIPPLAGQEDVELEDNVQPTVQFTDRQGKTYIIHDIICGSYGVGEVVALWYLPDNPDKNMLEKDSPTLFGFAIALSVVILITLIVMLVYGVGFLFLIVALARGSNQGSVTPMYSPVSYSPAPMGGAPMGGMALGGAHHRVGELVSVAGRWAITCANPSPSQGAGMVQAQPGRFFLLTPLTIRNTSNEPLNVAQTVFRLFDGAGVEYQRAKTMEGMPPGFIQPGAQEQMTLAYDVPGTVRQYRLSFYLSTSSLAQANWDFMV
jgi:hypothetical protein